MSRPYAWDRRTRWDDRPRTPGSIILPESADPPPTSGPGESFHFKEVSFQLSSLSLNTLPCTVTGQHNIVLLHITNIMAMRCKRHLAH